MPLVIGLTGSIASGKSTVSHMFTELNIPVVDADELSRTVVEPGKKAYQQIVDAFGEIILYPDKTINRQKLGEIVFADETRRHVLNSIVHPAVREDMLKQRDELVQSDVPAVVLDIPLLFESNLTHYVDRTLVVAVKNDVQLNRLMERDKFDEQHARERIQSQMPIKEKADKADAVIDNNKSKEHTYNQLKDILKRWHIV